MDDAAVTVATFDMKPVHDDSANIVRMNSERIP